MKPTIVYGSAYLTLNNRDEIKMYVIEVGTLKWVFGGVGPDKIRNEYVRKSGHTTIRIKNLKTLDSSKLESGFEPISLLIFYCFIYFILKPNQ